MARELDDGTAMAAPMMEFPSNEQVQLRLLLEADESCRKAARAIGSDRDRLLGAAAMYLRWSDCLSHMGRDPAP